MVFDLDEVIAAAKREVEKPAKQSQHVAVGGRLVSVTVVKLRSDEWENLTALHPMRQTADADAVGWNTTSLPPAYPAVSLAVEDEPISQEKWAELFGVMNSKSRQLVVALMFGVNVFEGVMELARLGKQAAGMLSASPASSASLPEDSSDSSPQK